MNAQCSREIDGFRRAALAMRLELDGENFEIRGKGSTRSRRSARERWEWMQRAERIEGLQRIESRERVAVPSGPVAKSAVLIGERMNPPDAGVAIAWRRADLLEATGGGPRVGDIL